MKSKKDSTEFNIGEKLGCKRRFENCEFEVYRSHREIKNGEAGIYSEGLLPYTLIYQKEEEDDITDEQFYDTRFKSREHQVNALDAIEKTFHHFVAIGVNEETHEIEVKVKFKFPRLM